MKHYVMIINIEIVNLIRRHYMKNYNNMTRSELILKILFLERRMNEKQIFIDMLVKRIELLLKEVRR